MPKDDLLYLDQMHDMAREALQEMEGYDVVWDVLTRDLPPLIAALEVVLPRPPEE